MTVSTSYSAFSQLVIPGANVPGTDPQTSMVLTQVCGGLATWTLRVANALNKLMPAGAVVPVSQGGTGLSSGNSGGIPYFNSTTTMASSASLLLNGLVIGGGVGGAPTTASVFTAVNSDQTLQGNNNVASFVNPITAVGISYQQADAANSYVQLNAFGSPVSVGVIGQVSAGTGATPTALTNQGFTIQLRGYDGTAWSGNQGQVKIGGVTSPWTTGDHSTQILFQTTPVGSTTLGTVATFTNQGCAILGTNTNDNAAAGYVGEYVSTITLIAAEVNINGPANVCSLSLTAGDWDVSGELWVDTATGAATVNGRMQASITQTTATQATVPSDSIAKAAFDALPLVSTVSAVVLPIGPVRLLIAPSPPSPNVFLVGSCGTSAGTAFGYGKLSARRRR